MIAKGFASRGRWSCRPPGKSTHWKPRGQVRRVDTPRAARYFLEYGPSPQFPPFGDSIMRLRIPFRFALGLLILAVAAAAVQAEIKLPSIVSDNMVLQAGQAAPIWGWDEPGQKVTVRLGDKTAEATAGADGRWQVTLDGLKPGAAMEMLIEDAAGDKKTIKNVLVGEVWVCSGQSNMQWSVTASRPRRRGNRRGQVSGDPILRRHPRDRPKSPKPPARASGSCAAPRRSARGRRSATSSAASCSSR